MTQRARAAGYIRVSTISQVQEGESLTTQQKQIEAYCNFKGWDLVKLYEDAGLSGAKDTRPGLQALLQDAAKSKFQVVIVADLSRFCRNTRDLLNNIQLLKDNDTGFVTIKENIDATGHYGQFMLQVLGAIAELERNVIIARTSENRLARWRDKRILVGNPPYGYRWNKTTLTIEPVSEEVDTYHRIVSAYLNFQKSLADIAEELQKDYVPTKRTGNAGWSAPVIGRILSNPSYYTGKIQVNKAKELIVYDIKPIISKSRWDEIQKHLNEAKTRSGRPSKAKDVFLLYGQLKCGQCGARLSTLYSSRPHADGTYLRQYACHWHFVSQRKLSGHTRCSLPYIDAEEIEKVVWERLLWTLNSNIDETKLMNTSHWVEKEKLIENKVKNHQAEQKKSVLALNRLDQLLKSDNFEPGTYLSMRTKYQNEIAQYALELQEATEELNRLRQMREEERALIQFAKDRADLLRQVTETLNNLPFSDKQRFVKGMLSAQIEIGLLPDLDWMEDEDAEPPEKLQYMHWKEGLFVPFRFNWPLLREILEKNMPPDGSGNDNLDNRLDTTVRVPGETFQVLLGSA